MAESILDATEQQLKRAQAKITYLGEQTKPIPTVVFFTEGHKPSRNSFLKVQRSPHPYTNDELPYTVQFSVTAFEFRRILSTLKPVLTKEEIGKGPQFLSFSIVRENGSQIEGHEFAIGPSFGEVFYRRLISALEPKNEAARTGLAKQFRNVYPEHE